LKFTVFAYNFPHWKTQTGLFNLFINGFKPDIVILQDKKVLNIPESKYRITPRDEYLLDPKEICVKFNIPFIVREHNDWINVTDASFAVILGARILKKALIEQYPQGVLNIHPGILPGNRGLDNLKWAIVNNLPIGVTAHWIDEKIDMGRIISTMTIDIYEDDTIRDLYLRQRNAEQNILIKCLMSFAIHGITKGEACEWSEKFSIVPDELDLRIDELLNKRKLREAV